jgi:hypothetical protein
LVISGKNIYITIKGINVLITPELEIIFIAAVFFALIRLWIQNTDYLCIEMLEYCEFEAVGACAPTRMISWTFCRRKRTAEKPGNGGKNMAVHNINCEYKNENGKSRSSEENIVSRRKCHYAGEGLA